MTVSFFYMEGLHGVDFVFKEINSRNASVKLSGSKQKKKKKVVVLFLIIISPFWVSMVGRSRLVSKEVVFS